MRRFLPAAAAALVLVLSATAAAAPQASVTGTQVIKRFRKATTYLLRTNEDLSYEGVQAIGYGLNMPMTLRAKYGRFVIYVISGGDVESTVGELLVDVHTGELGTPDARGIYWERDATIGGEVYWTAKKRFGDNVVLWWYTLGETQGTDAAYSRLSKILRTKVVL
jgi:hypothetical protein